MKISYKCDYALKVLLELALNVNQGVLSSQELSKKLDIPLKFLEQVLSDLRKGGFVESRRGNMGGYALVGLPEKITLGAVIRHIDGSVEPIECVNPKYKNCRERQTCAYKNVWIRVHQAITNIIDNVTLEDMLRDTRSAQEALNYSI
ncbi:putative transcriptional regulator BadM/Rrf2 family [Candidatus Termititenax persephonae]|uniref:Transcriptional regulator BadM/Rrf2 family n=1 Tax=Candidatus Termititenax persephonae TaxID=2218525 RepID=A0A388THN0_9BACT|nr:putative transcriptional regulator BadM/Rrf2 family [Candidatus Termititenax persephonae]